jgi:hypothetical protein
VIDLENPGGVPVGVLAQQFAAAPDATGPGVDDELLALPTIPATSPIMRKLQDELRQTVALAPPDSPLRHLASRILRAQTDLRGALADPAFPEPSRDRVAAVIDAIMDETAETDETESR